MHAFNGELQDELAAAMVLEAEIAESQAISTDPPFFRTVTTKANTIGRTFLPPMELDEQQASTLVAFQEADGLPDATDGQPAIADVEEQRESETVSLSRDRAAAVSKLLSEILRTTPELHAHLTKIGFDNVDGANSELASCKFGPSTRTLFNVVATFLKTRAETVATELESWNKNLPPGAPFAISSPGMNAAVAMAEVRKNLAKCRIGTVEFDRAPEERTLEDLADAHKWIAEARGAVREAQLRWQALNTDELVRRYNAKGQLERWLSQPTMSAKELADFEAARGEWLDTVTNVRRYAENIARFHEMTRQKDSSSLRAWTFSYAGGLFPDDAIKGVNFPGKVIRDPKTGEVTEIELSLPSNLERTPENIAKIRRLQEWLEKNAPEVDKVVKELFEAKVSQERVLTFMDVPVDDEAKDYNFIRKRFEAHAVTIGDKPLIKVITSDQKMYAGTFSYLKQLNVSKIGPEDSTGTIRVGEYRVKETEYGRPISVGSKGSIKIEGTGIAENHCAIIAKEDGRVFIRSSKDTNTFVRGKKVGTEAIEIVDPVNEPVTIGGISLPSLSELRSGIKEFDKEYSLGSKGEILGANVNANDEQGTVKVTKDGRVFLRANDQFSIFINGKKASSTDFVEVTATDSITLGGVSLPLSSNFRLYSPEDWVPVFLDGAVHLVQATKLPNFANECWRWYAAGNSAVAAMDVGMIVSGGIALKVATRQAGKLIAARQLVANTAIGTGEAFLHSWKMAPIRNLHSVFGIGLGVTGLAHQSIENLGPTGHTFLEYRGYAMMLDIFASTVVTDVISASRSVAGRFVAKAGKAAETTTEVAEKLTRWENLATTLSSKTMLLCNAYFVHDIIARQAPAIIAKYYGYDSDALVDTSLRSAFAVSGSKSQLLKRLMEEVKDDFIKAANPEDQEVLRNRLQETACIVSAKEQGVDVSNFVTERSAVYLTASGVEKTAAALSLLMLCRDGSGQIPGVLAQVRIDHSQELPVSLKRDDVVKYLRAESPLRNRHFNSPEAILGEAFLAKAERLRNATPEQRQGDAKLWATLFAANGDRKVAAAQALQRLFEKEGRLPEEIIRIQTADGKPRTITGAEIEQCLAETRTKSTLLSLESLCKNNTDNGAISHLLESTRHCVNNSVLAKGEQEKATAAMHLQQQARILTRAIHDTTDDTAKCYLHMALILVNLDAKSGMLPARLGQGKESDTITAAGALDYLQRKITLLPPGMRLEAAGLLNQYGYSAMGGTSTRNDWNALFLTILNDKNSSVDEIRRAILGGNTPGLVHTTGSLWQESSANLSPEAALAGNGDLTGRDKAAIEKSLRSLADHSAPEVRALSVRLLLALSNQNPVARNLELVELTSKPKSLEELAAEAKETLETVGLDNSSGGPAGSNRASVVTVRQLRNALLISLMPDAAELLPKMENRSEKLTKLLISSCNPNDAALFSEAARNVTSRFPSLAPRQQVELVERMTDFICRASLQDSQFETAARLEVLKQLAQLVKANPDILNFQVAKTSSNLSGGTMLKTRLTGLLAPGSGRTGGGTEIRVAVAELFGACGTLDSNCRATLVESLKSDRQPKVRNAAFDALKALQDPFLLETAREGIRKETDIELLRKLQSVTERVGPTEASPAELQARFERACSRITGSALTNLNGAEEFLKVNYPLLIGTNVDKQNAQKFDAEYAGILGGLRWVLSSNQNIDNQAVETKRQTKEQLRRQVVELCRRAGTSTGQEELKALGWILISNGASIRDEHKKDMLELAVRGLSDACRSNDRGSRNQASHILLMCIATQPELPIDIKRHLLSALDVLPNSSLSSGDASIALLLALRSHLHNMPQGLSDADYESARLYQSSLLRKLEQFPSAEAVPILRAISETTYQFKIERTASGAIHAINYPDEAKRSFRYDELDKLNFVCYEKGREKITWRRDAENKWLASDGRDAGASIELDSKTGRVKITFHDGRFEYKDACGATISGRNQRVERVAYPDGSSRSLQYNQDKCVAYTYASADGKTETWKRSSERNKWYRSDDKTFKNPWRGDFSFDAATGYFCCGRDSVETRTANGTYLKNTSNFGSLLEHRDGPMSKWISKLDGQTDNNYSLLICPDGSYGRRFESTFKTKPNDQIDGPSYGDASPNRSERNRQQAASLLEELQSGTKWLIRRAERETSDSPPVQDKTKTARDLADGLILQLERCGTKNGPSVEQVAGAILLAGKVLPIEVPDDPRRVLYRKFSTFENERVKFAAAYSLYHSAVKEDQILSIEILARLRGSSPLQAEIQSLLESTSCPTALSFAERDLLVSQAKVARNSVTLEPPSKEQYESSTVYALAKVDLLRNAQRLLRPADDCNWWKENGYELLHQYHFTAKSTRPSAPEKLSGLRQREEEQFKKLLEDARKTDQIGETARIALAYIVLNNGAPLNIERKSEWSGKASAALVEIYRHGGPNSSDVIQWLKAALVSQSVLDTEAKIVIADSLMTVLSSKNGNQGHIGHAETISVLTAALENELYRSKGANFDHKYSTHLIRHLEKLESPDSLPILRAIEKSDLGSATVAARRAISSIETPSLRKLASLVVPDRTSSMIALTAQLKVLLDGELDERTTILEMMRLSDQRKVIDTKADPRIEQLERTLSSENPRIKLAGVLCIANLDPMNHRALKTLSELATTPGQTQSEAMNLLQGKINSVPPPAMIAALIDSCVSGPHPSVVEVQKLIANIFAIKSSCKIILPGERTVLLCKTESGISLEEYRNEQWVRSHAPIDAKKANELYQLIETGHSTPELTVALCARLVATTDVVEKTRLRALQTLLQSAKESSDEKVRFEAAKVLSSLPKDGSETEKTFRLQGLSEIALLSETAGTESAREEARRYVMENGFRTSDIFNGVLKDLQYQYRDTSSQSLNSEAQRARQLMGLVHLYTKSNVVEESDRHLLWKAYTIAVNRHLSEQTPIMQSMRTHILADLRAIKNVNKADVASLMSVVNCADQGLAFEAVKALLVQESYLSKEDSALAWKTAGKLCACGDSEVRKQSAVLLNNLTLGTLQFDAARSGLLESIESAVQAKQTRAVEFGSHFALQWLKKFAGDNDPAITRLEKLHQDANATYSPKNFAKQLEQQFNSGDESTISKLLVEVRTSLLAAGDADDLEMANTRLQYVRLCQHHYLAFGSTRHYSKPHLERQITLACNTFQRLGDSQAFMEMAALSQFCMPDEQSYELLKASLALLEKHPTPNATPVQIETMTRLYLTSRRLSAPFNVPPLVKDQLEQEAIALRTSILDSIKKTTQDGHGQARTLLCALQVLGQPGRDSQERQDYLRTLRSLTKELDLIDERKAPLTVNHEILACLWQIGTNLSHRNPESAEEVFDCYFGLARRLPADATGSLKGLERVFASQLESRANAITTKTERDLEQKQRLQQKASLYRASAAAR